MTKKPAEKKSAKKSTNGKATGPKGPGKKPNAIHEKLMRLMTRPNGATITDIADAGFKCASMQALKIAERRGLKVRVDKKPGELTRYIAKKA
jgi:hypothetical protein